MNQFIIILFLLTSLLSCGEGKNVDEDFRRKVSGHDYEETHYVRTLNYWVKIISKDSEKIIIHLKSNYYIRHEQYVEKVDFVLQADLSSGIVKNSYRPLQLGQITCLEFPGCESFEIRFDQDVEFHLKFIGIPKTIEGTFSINSPFLDWDYGILYSHEVQFSGIEKMKGQLYVSDGNFTNENVSLDIDWSPYEGYSPSFKYHQTLFKVFFPRTSGEDLILYSSLNYSTGNSPLFSMEYFNLDKNSFYILFFRFKETGLENE
jgi:hypothetical protein